MHGVGGHAPRHVAAAHRMDPGLSLRRLPMGAQRALEGIQLLGPATQICVQVSNVRNIFYLDRHKPSCLIFS